MSENLKVPQDVAEDQQNVEEDHQENEPNALDLERLSRFCAELGDEKALAIFQQCLQDPPAKFAHQLSDEFSSQDLQVLQDLLMNEQI